MFHRKGRTLVALALSLSLLAAGCGSDDDEAAVSGSTAAATTAAPAATTAAPAATTAAPATTVAEAEAEAASAVVYEAPPEDSSIGYAWSIPLRSLDPHATPSNFDPIYIGLAYDTLIVREFDGTFSPMLATSWEFVEPDVLELKLREGVTFHGGRAFDAEAVVLNFERVTTAETSTRGGPLAAAIASVEAVDSMTVRMTLGDGPGVIFGALSSMGGMMINPDAFDTDLSVTADGTGPYRVTEVLAGESVTFKRFEDTWAPQDARVSNLKIVTNKDSSQRVNLLLTGDVDATNIDTHQIEMLEAEGYTTHFRVGDDAFVMQLNWERIPDAAARQAIESSIDRALILEGIHKGVSEAGGQVQTMGDPAYNSSVSPDPDVQRAIQLAADSGLKGSTLQLMTAGVPNLEAYAQAIQPMLEQLGVTVEITLVEWGQLNPEWATGNYDLSLIYFTGNSDLALSYDALLGADSALNPAGTVPGGIDAMIAATFSETDPEVRTQQFSDLAAAVDEEAVVAVLVHPVQPIVTAPGIEINADRLRLFGGFNLRGIHRSGDAPERSAPAAEEAVVVAAAPTIAKLITGMGQNPVSMDPQTITQVSANQLAFAVYDPLVWQLVVDGQTEIFPGLAESWDVSDDLTEYTFNLREADFHDGTPFNADAVKYMFDRITDPDLEAGLALGTLGKSYESSEVIDDRTVKVIFSEPNGGFLTSLGSPKLLVPSPTAIETLGADFALNPVGTGPFKFVEFADQQHVLLERNDNYSWGPAALGSGPAEIGEIEFRVLSDAIAQVNAVRTGEIHVAHSPPLSVQNLGGLEADGFVVLRGATRGTPFSFIFNVENVSDVRVRQALAHATDKQRLMDTVFQGQYQAATAVITQSTPGFPGYEFYPFDPDRARALLDEAGWLVGDGGKRYKDGEQLVLDWWNMTDFPVYDEMAPFLQAQYSSLLGVDVNINSQSWPGIGDTLSTGIHDVGITSLKQPDGLSSIGIVLSCAGDARKGGFNWSFYCDEEVDAAVGAARQLPDGPEKYAATEAIVSQIMEASPYIPMIEPQVVVVHPSDLGGFDFNGTDGTVLYHGVHTATAAPAAEAVAELPYEPVVFSNIAPIPSIDPHIGYDSAAMLFIRSVYDSLLEFPPGSEPAISRPALATSWEWSDDGLGLTLQLRAGVVFHDGYPFDSEDVIRSLERIEAINQGPATNMGSISGYEALGPYKVHITLSQPNVFFEGTLPKIPIVSAEAIEAGATSDDPWATDWFASNEAGSGPYTLESHSAETITMEGYPGYWRPFEPGTPTHVTLRTDPDITSAVLQMCEGEIDMLGGLSPDDTTAAIQCDDVKSVVQARFGVGSVVFNMQTDGPTSDPLVRKAIAKAFDYDAWNEFYGGRTEAPTGPLPSNADIGPLPPESVRDVAGAQQLMAEAGYPDAGPDNIAFTISYAGIGGLSFEEFFGTLLQENLKEIGIGVEQVLVPWGQLVEMTSNPDTAADMAFLILNMTSPDPSSLLKSGYITESFADQGGYNWAYYSNALVDELTASVATIADREERGLVLRQIQDQMIDDQVAVWVPMAPIYQPVRDNWTVKYEPLDFVVSVRFFFARNTDNAG